MQQVRKRRMVGSRGAKGVQCLHTPARCGLALYLLCNF